MPVETTTLDHCYHCGAKGVKSNIDHFGEGKQMVSWKCNADDAKCMTHKSVEEDVE